MKGRFLLAVAKGLGFSLLLTVLGTLYKRVKFWIQSFGTPKGAKA
jgi:hypothetical protein